MAQFGMSDAHKAVLRSNRLALVQQLHVDETFLAVLMRDKILSEIQKENIDVRNEFFLICYTERDSFV